VHRPPNSALASTRWHVWLEEHTRHAAPPAPQKSATWPLKQAPLVSQQPSQFDGPQDVFMATAPQVRSLRHVWELGHATHSVPPAPQAVASEPARQVSVIWSQQPVQLAVVHFGAGVPHAEATSNTERVSAKRSMRASYTSARQKPCARSRFTTLT
jgi:hypothetical protein